MARNDLSTFHDTIRRKYSGTATVASASWFSGHYAAPGLVCKSSFGPLSNLGLRQPGWSCGKFSQATSKTKVQTHATHELHIAVEHVAMPSMGNCGSLNFRPRLLQMNDNIPDKQWTVVTSQLSLVLFLNKMLCKPYLQLAAYRCRPECWSYIVANFKFMKSKLCHKAFYFVVYQLPDTKSLQISLIHRPGPIGSQLLYKKTSILRIPF